MLIKYRGDESVTGLAGANALSLVLVSGSLQFYGRNSRHD